jgi:DNA-binding transcriptional LysR family regulator
MNLRHLEHFLAVAETGSFSRAAEKLFLTQSALSRSIQSLEGEIDGKLLDRVGKRNELTPLGRLVKERAQRMVLEASELKRGVELMRQANAGVMRLGLGSGPGAILMTPLMCHMATFHPRVQVRLVRGPTDLQLVQLRARQLDALVVDMRVVPPSPDLHIEPVAEMAGGWLVRTGHPLLQRRSVGLADVLAFPVASNPLSDEVTRAVVAQYGPQANPAQMITLECNDLESLIDVAERTDTVLLCVLAAARERIKAGAMAVLPVRPTLQATARFAYVTLVGRSQAPVMGLLRDFVAQRLAD